MAIHSILLNFWSVLSGVYAPPNSPQRRVKSRLKTVLLNYLKIFFFSYIENNLKPSDTLAITVRSSSIFILSKYSQLPVSLPLRPSLHLVITSSTPRPPDSLTPFPISPLLFISTLTSQYHLVISSSLNTYKPSHNILSRFPGYVRYFQTFSYIFIILDIILFVPNSIQSIHTPHASATFLFGGVFKIFNER